MENSDKNIIKNDHNDDNINNKDDLANIITVKSEKK